MHALFFAWLHFEINREGVKLKVKQSDGNFFVHFFWFPQIFDFSIWLILPGEFSGWLNWCKGRKSFWIPLIGHSPETSAAFSDNLLPRNCILFAKSRLNNLWTPSEKWTKGHSDFYINLPLFFYLLFFFLFTIIFDLVGNLKKNVFLDFPTWKFFLLL